MSQTSIKYMHNMGIVVASLDNAIRFFIEQGAMIGLRLVGNKIHMDVNLEAAQHASLHISSQLLRLATVIKQP